MVFYYDTALYNSFITSKQLLITVGALCTLVGLLISRKSTNSFSPLGLWLLLLVLGLVVSVNMPQALSSFAYQSSLIIFAIGIALWVERLQFLRVITTIGAVVAATALYQYLATELPSQGLIATLGHKNYAAQIQLAALPAGAYLLLRAQRLRARGFYALCVTSIILHLSVANSRAALVALIAVAALVAALSGGKQWRQLMRGAALLSLPLILALGAGLLLPRPQSNIKDMGQRLELGTLRSENRLNFYANSLAMLAAHPQGVGLDNFQIVYPRYYNASSRDMEHHDSMILTNPHNEYLRIAIEQGVVALLLFCGGMLWLLASLWRRWRGGEVSAMALLAICLAMLVDALVSFPLLNPASALLFWATVAMALPSSGASGFSGRALRLLLILAFAALAFQGQRDYRMNRAMGRADFQRAAEIAPGNYYAHYYAATAFMVAGEWDKALAANERVRALSPWFVQAYYQCGEILKGRGDVEFAIRAYWRALEIHPHALKNYTALADAYRILGDRAAAQDAYATFFAKMDDLEYRGEFSARDLSHTYNNYAILVSEAGEGVRAAALFAEAIKVDSRNPQPYFNLGSLHFAGGEYARAAELYRRGVALDPSSQGGWYNLALAELKLRNATGAEAAIAQLRNLGFSSPNLIYLEASLADVARDGRRALLLYRRYLKEGTLDTKLRKEIEARIMAIVAVVGE